MIRTRADRLRALWRQPALTVVRVGLLRWHRPAMAMIVIIIGVVVAFTAGLSGCATYRPSEIERFPIELRSIAPDERHVDVSTWPMCMVDSHLVAKDRALHLSPVDSHTATKPTTVAGLCDRRWLGWGAVDDATVPLIFAVHGFGDHAGSFAVLGEAMEARSIAVLAFDQAGFGLNEDRSFWPGSERLIDDVAVALESFRKLWPDRSIWILGKSMGGAVAWLSLGEHSLDVNGAVLLAPAVWGWSRQSWLQRYGLKAFRTLAPDRAFSAAWMRRVDIQPTNDAEIVARIRNDRIVLRFARLEALYGVSMLMDRAAEMDPRRVAVPVYVVAGGRDEVIRPHAVCAWVKGLSWPDSVRADWRSDAYHMLTRYSGREAIFDDLARLVHDQLAAFQAVAELRKGRMASGKANVNETLKGTSSVPALDKKWLSMQALEQQACNSPDPRAQRIARQ